MSAENKELVENELTQVPNDGITSLAWHPLDPNILLVGSWDSNVRLYNTSANPDESLKSTFPVRGAVLAVCFSGKQSKGSRIYAGGIDKNVREIDVETSKQRILGTHDEPISCIAWSEETTWDSTLRIFKPFESSPPGDSAPSDSNPPPTIIKLPAKAFSIDVKGPYLVVAMALRHIWIWKLSDLAAGKTEPEYQREGSLKYMMRSVRIATGAESYVCSSIEGRVAVEFFDTDPAVQAKKYAFKSHRQQIDGVDNVYPVNAIAFHPSYQTFATGGGDAIVSVWDLNARKRIRQYPKLPSSVSNLAFNEDGTKLAIACSINPEEGSGTNGRNALIIRAINSDECKPKK